GNQVENHRLALGFLGHPLSDVTHAPVDSGRLYYYAFTVNKIPVGILGASGYVGRELCALIRGHPSLTLAFATANEQRGVTVRIGGRDLTYSATEDAPLKS